MEQAANRKARVRWCPIGRDRDSTNRHRFSSPCASTGMFGICGARRCFRAIAACFETSLGRFGLRLIEFSVLGNHLHLIVEADDTESLSRGMQGLGVRMAKALNRVMGARGRVFADHYHARLLQTSSELVNAIAYVLGNSAHHYGGESGGDPFSSANCDRELLLGKPLSWLLRVGWRRAAHAAPEWCRSFLAALPEAARIGVAA